MKLILLITSLSVLMSADTVLMPNPANANWYCKSDDSDESADMFLGENLSK